MQFNAVFATLFATAAAVALPAAELLQRQVPYTPCSGLQSTALCCATDVLGVVNLDCGTPLSTPSNGTEFSAICAEIGQRARCCAIPILEQGILCTAPSGVQG
ncbi:hypothetical protein GGTG_03085 [Gaeumannomyces tritici R3-111a-1]|uniref:Hydrophobin n=1 Tax=Gaeumannomyces tritici (strain R3-111a-1) TaxID=644352 RepID=J3NP79_GAET3|nr:hypothetical protein GGTG_03085 [Gaeumannomyces tritici R3-111a-1]EJT77982.1 hypothetical protein GGTG_03085 [Gaeumannomyces tritici R3-111a-1]